LRVAIVTVTYEAAGFLAPFLAGLAALEPPRPEVVIVDNASRDGSAELVARLLPSATLVRAPANLGFAGGSNAGARASDADVLLFLNPDTIPPRDLVAPLVAALDEPGVGVVGCKLVFPDGRIQSAGGVLGPDGHGAHRGWGEPDDGRWDAPADVDYVPGAALAIRRDLFWRLGGFHDGYFPGFYEDAELCLRARVAGLRARWVPRPAIPHLESPVMSARRTYWMERNRLRFLARTQAGGVRVGREAAWCWRAHGAPLARALVGLHAWKARTEAATLGAVLRAYGAAAADALRARRAGGGQRATAARSRASSGA
jgi:GT2 family glycosyltransferase